MFKRYSQAQINEAERKSWTDAKARGKMRFIWWETARGLLIWSIVLPVLQVFEYHERLLSLQFIGIWLAILPVFLLGGYLTGSWKWKDFEKKYPE